MCCCVFTPEISARAQHLATGFQGPYKHCHRKCMLRAGRFPRQRARSVKSDTTVASPCVALCCSRRLSAVCPEVGRPDLCLPTTRLDCIIFAARFGSVSAARAVVVLNELGLSGASPQTSGLCRCAWARNVLWRWCVLLRHSEDEGTCKGDLYTFVLTAFGAHAQ